MQLQVKKDPYEYLNIDSFSPGVSDPELDKLARFRNSKSGKRGHNAARDFHRWAHRNKKTFGVPLSEISIPLRICKRNKSGAKRIQHCESPHAVIHFTDWFATILQTHPSFFLAGFGIEDASKHEEVFSSFWEKFEACEPGHPVFHEKTQDERKHCVPIAVHGDEGRGLGRQPILVISFQTVIPSTGPDCLSLSTNLRRNPEPGFFLFLFCSGTRLIHPRKELCAILSWRTLKE